MIGVTMDFGNFERYVLGQTTELAELEYVGGRTQSGSGTTSNITVSLTGLSGGTDTEPLEGDIVIIAIELCGTSDKSYRISGYTEIADLYANDTEDSNLQVGYKFMGATPDTSASITGGTGSTADAYAISIHVWRNVDSTTPLDVTPTTISQINTGIPNPPAITPTTSGAQILVAAGTAHTGGTDTFGASYLDNFLTVGGNDDNDATVGMGSILWTSGAYDPAAWTFSQSDSTAFSTNSVSFALRPATVTVDILGNRKRSGIWALQSAYNFKYQEYLDTLGIKFIGEPTSSTGTSIDLPIDLLQNDIVFIASFSDGTTQNLPTGFTAGQTGAATNSVSYRWSYKIMGVTPDSTATGLSSSSIHVAFAVRNVDTSVIFDQTTPAIATNTAGMPNPPAITTQTSQAKVIVFGFLDDDIVNDVDAPTGFELLTTQTYGSSGAGGTIMVAFSVPDNIGTIDAGAFNGSGSDSWVAATIALRWDGV